MKSILIGPVAPGSETLVAASSVTVDVGLCPLGVSPVDSVGVDGLAAAPLIRAEGGLDVVAGALTELAQDDKNIENTRHGRAVIAFANSHTWPTRVQSAECRLQMATRARFNMTYLCQGADYAAERQQWELARTTEQLAR